ncbi:Concanavalin A-like lectin/glucanase subgroup [Penicillium paradoxum]|uniref:Concanavalin A-like lectin/glucanase subgroup n=1 Tax=Penicillium paradoxum TaxID=176176 RepID=UPI00254842BF|nr:Concanavalin A-like lectin/glucanase subgroup [Penicillium paradoxum]KAJ5795289.1 Concanavalin A-like lectin/glucanase subgroup [Penicillium paradoxum]
MDNHQLPQLPQDQYSGASRRVSTETKTPIATASQPETDATTKYPCFNPRGWSLRKQILVGATVILALLVVIVVPVEVIQNRYPNYTPLHYQLADEYSGPTFFDHFTYFTDADPTNGFVVYVNEHVAADLNLTHASNTSAVLRVDSTTPNTLSGRNSVRVESKKTYDTGLFIFDIIHTPFGCGTWPALWLTDPDNWPNNGEIDVLETTNEGTHGNEITIHTTAGCNMDVKRKETGQAVSTNCHNATAENSGCGVIGGVDTYGQAMNNLGGGVYALELRTEGIRVWFFPRDSIPSDITSENPDPSTWGTALADFPSTDCDIAAHFRNQSIIVNIDLCGDLAAQPQFYDTLYHCPASCTSFVAHNPHSFVDAYWEFNSFKVYQAV